VSSGENERAEGARPLLAGRYRILEQLGRGGMGVVCRARDEVLGREVAVKELRTYNDASTDELADLRLRMQREARAAARVRHPGVVAVHDIAEHDGRPVIVMELVDGPSLDDVLTERQVLDPGEVAAIGAKVLEALDVAHRAGVLHRDVKPGNILLERGGRIVLTDFGIATMEDPGDGSTTHLTRSGELLGSLDYLAPERAQGQEPGPASDIWALGATLYAAVEGSSPFRRTSTWSTLTAIVADPLPEPVRAGPLAPVLQHLMHKDPAARPDASTAARMLAAVAEGGSAPAAPGGVIREPTVRSVPSVPPGFGPALGVDGRADGVDGGAGFAAAQEPSAPAHAATPMVQGDAPGEPPGLQRPVSPGPGAPYAPFGAPGEPTSPVASGVRRDRQRATVAAAVAAVLLVCAGATYVVVDRSSSDAAGQAAGSEATTGQSPSTGPGESDAVGDKAERPEVTKESGASPSPPAETKDPAGGTDKDTGTSGSGADDGSGGTTGSEDSGGSGADGGSPGGGSPVTSGGTTSGGSGPTPKASCHSIGGGKYNCWVWKTAKSYTASGQEAGLLYAGTNYFYCQQNLARRETYGEWTNVWWAKTDDDSGNRNVFVSDVYIKGGANDEPVPGLPEC
jgi:tRNA A-37 threonylcarbamoyl transferase component Bud32